MFKWLLNSNFIVQQFVLKCFSFCIPSIGSVLSPWSTQYKYTVSSLWWAFIHLTLMLWWPLGLHLHIWLSAQDLEPGCPSSCWRPTNFGCAVGGTFSLLKPILIYKMDKHYLIVFILKIQYDNPWKMYSIPLKEVEHNSPPFKSKLHMVHSFQRVQSENGKIRTMQGETLINTTAAMCSRLISTVIRNVDSVYPWYDVISVSCSVEPNSLWPHGP